MSIFELARLSYFISTTLFHFSLQNHTPSNALLIRHARHAFDELSDCLNSRTPSHNAQRLVDNCDTALRHLERNNLGSYPEVTYAIKSIPSFRLV